MGGTKGTGRVRWFNGNYGFIVVDDDGGDVWFRSDDLRCKTEEKSVTKDSKVEFEVAIDEDGRMKAIKVTGPNGDYCIEQTEEEKKENKKYKKKMDKGRARKQ